MALLRLLLLLFSVFLKCNSQVPACGATVSACSTSIYRRIDGSCTNLQTPILGVPNSTYVRLLPPRYGDGLRTPRRATNGANLPSARTVRTRLFPTGTRQSTTLSLLTMQFGQFVAHDMSLTREVPTPQRCCSVSGRFQTNPSSSCFPVSVLTSDTTMGLAGIECINFTRTVTDKDLGCSQATAAANQLNVVTSWMDLSLVYGLNDGMARALRTLTGGRLITTVRNGRIYPPNESNVPLNCPCSLANENTCFRTGDSRANQSPHLTILQIMFVREHNRLATRLAAINPHWTDERLYQEARRIAIAAYQYVSYYEWLPNLLGPDNLVRMGIVYPGSLGYINDYSSLINPGVSQEHSQAAFRFFHTNIAGLLNAYNSQGTVTRTVRISNWWNRPQILINNDTINQLTLGLVAQRQEESDNIFVEPVTDRMFACRDQGFGIDLRAADFQRDRDHGLAYYNEYRRYCGLKVAASFDDYADLISPTNIAILKTLYASYQDVDLSVGGSLETFAYGAQVGPTFQCIMNDQFLRTRKSDRLWFEHSTAGFSYSQLYEIKKASAARLFCDNGDGITNIQGKAFVTSSSMNPIVSCSQIPSMNLEAWRVAAPN